MKGFGFESGLHVGHLRRDAGPIVLETRHIYIDTRWAALFSPMVLLMVLSFLEIMIRASPFSGLSAVQHLPG